MCEEIVYVQAEFYDLERKRTSGGLYSAAQRFQDGGDFVIKSGHLGGCKGGDRPYSVCSLYKYE